jgi:hypothetical protein
MSRERGAPEASAYLRSFDFEPPASAFDAAFASERIDERIT